MSALSPISTHDLTRRSTLFTGKLWQDREFQLTTSRGGRPRPFRSGPFFTHFNSRPHEEVDGEDPKHNSGNCISTHDLTRRSTVTSCNTEKEIEISTHDLTRRSTAQVRQSQKKWNISTHDLTRRSTEVINGLSASGPFQLTTSRGGRLVGCLSDRYIVSFQLTTSRGGRL